MLLLDASRKTDRIIYRYNIKYIYTVPGVPKCLFYCVPPPPPSPASECAPPPRTGGAHSSADEGVGEVQFQRLEKKLSTLTTLRCINF